MSLGPKVTVAANNVQPLKKPIANQEREIAAKLPDEDARKLDRLIRAERGAGFWRGVGIGAPLFIAIGAALAIYATTALFDPMAKQTLQLMVAKHSFETTTGQ